MISGNDTFESACYGGFSFGELACTVRCCGLCGPMGLVFLTVGFLKSSSFEATRKLRWLRESDSGPQPL